jgi:hypothetical protein
MTERYLIALGHLDECPARVKCNSNDLDVADVLEERWLDAMSADDKQLPRDVRTEEQATVEARR